MIQKRSCAIWLQLCALAEPVNLVRSVRQLRYALLIVLISATACGKFAPPGDVSITTVKKDDHKLELHGHRGARGLAPENTWPAFEIAIQSDMTAIELDVHLTADLDLIIHHDPFTNPHLCTAIDGKHIHSERIAKLTVSELKNLDCGALTDHKFPAQIARAGTPLLTLSEFFSRLNEYARDDVRAANVKINIDVKFPLGKSISDAQVRDFAQLLNAKIQAAKMTDRIMIQSFEKRLSPAMKTIDPNITTALLFARKHWSKGREQWSKQMIKTTLAMQANILAPYKRDTNAQLIKLAHSSGLRVIAWTINDIDEMRGLIRMGIDGIISDYPDRLKVAANAELNTSKALPSKS